MQDNIKMQIIDPRNLFSGEQVKAINENFAKAVKFCKKELGKMKKPVDVLVLPNVHETNGKDIASADSYTYGYIFVRVNYTKKDMKKFGEEVFLIFCHELFHSYHFNQHNILHAEDFPEEMLFTVIMEGAAMNFEKHAKESFKIKKASPATEEIINSDGKAVCKKLEKDIFSTDYNSYELRYGGNKEKGWPKRAAYKAGYYLVRQKMEKENLTFTEVIKLAYKEFLV